MNPIQKTTLDNVNDAVTNHNDNLPVKSSTTRKVINVMASIAFFAGLVGTTATLTMITLSLIASAPISSTVAGIAAGAFALFVIGGVIAYLTRAKESVVAKLVLEQELLDAIDQNEKKVKTLEKKVTQLETALSNLKDSTTLSGDEKTNEIIELNKNIKTLNTEIETLTDDKTQLKLDLKTAKKELEVAQGKVEDTKEYKSIKKARDDLQTQLNAIKDKEKTKKKIDKKDKTEVLKFDEGKTSPKELNDQLQSKIDEIGKLNKEIIKLTEDNKTLKNNDKLKNLIKKEVKDELEKDYKSDLESKNTRITQLEQKEKNYEQLLKNISNSEIEGLYEEIISKKITVEPSLALKIKELNDKIVK
jgi:chromosome segregation ATPase